MQTLFFFQFLIKIAYITVQKKKLRKKLLQKWIGRLSLKCMKENSTKHLPHVEMRLIIRYDDFCPAQFY